MSAPENGDVGLSGVRPGSQALYSCDRGFNLVGEETRKCQRNGQWTGSAPTCESKQSNNKNFLFALFIICFFLLYENTEITCPKLTPPKYGKVRISGYCVDDYAVYGCAYGYQISHKDRRVCQEDGTWSGSEPTCDRKYVNKYSRHGYQYRG